MRLEQFKDGRNPFWIELMAVLLTVRNVYCKENAVRLQPFHEISLKIKTQTIPFEWSEYYLGSHKVKINESKSSF